jgi:hypothetical protein
MLSELCSVSEIKDIKRSLYLDVGVRASGPAAKSVLLALQLI